MSYLVATKTAVVEALRSVFESYPNADFAGDNAPLVSIEYPITQAHYPGVWVQYADNGELSRAGIDHMEEQADFADGTVHRVTRWIFTGSVTLTIVALSSWERDRLYDEVISTFISTHYTPTLYSFRETIEGNDHVAINVNFDDLQPFGDMAAQGTPWGTDEMLYEKSVSFDLRGEFLSDTADASLLPLSEVVFLKYLDGTPVPDWPTEPDSTTTPVSPGDWDRTQWL